MHRKNQCGSWLNRGSELQPNVLVARQATYRLCVFHDGQHYASVEACRILENDLFLWARPERPWDVMSSMKDYRGTCLGSVFLFTNFSHIAPLPSDWLHISLSSRKGTTMSSSDGIAPFACALKANCSQLYASICTFQYGRQMGDDDPAAEIYSSRAQGTLSFPVQHPLHQCRVGSNSFFP